MSSLKELRNERIRKLNLLRERGIDPYPARSTREVSIADYLKDFKKYEEAPTTIAGRILGLREHGGVVFADLFDGTGKVQILLKKDETGEEAVELFIETMDMGDFIEAKGTSFLTKTGQETLLVREWGVLSKSLRPLPDQHSGFENKEERLRKRYLDILTHEEVRDMIEKRAKFWQAVREYHIQHGFLEVHTPILEVTTGGGDARPFATHHHDLDLDLYLRISVGELWQKRLMVAGFPKTFEIGRAFRNEGISPEHAQDYEQCEAYWAYADYRQMYEFLKKCYQEVIEETFGTLQFSIRGFDVDFSGDWPLIDYAEEVKKQTGVDIWEASEGEMKTKLKELSQEFEDNANKERLIDVLWKYCRRSIGGPAILVNEPKITSPLAKSSPDNAHTVERFHFIIAGSEVGQGYSELNDPVDQRERFEHQQEMRDKGDEEAQMADMEFVEALEHGMPPTAGHGFSERLFAFLVDMPLREA
ncbi:MAG: lysine--tRNA ligase, partial [Candidatus Paceibacterota bacterium]